MNTIQVKELDYEVEVTIGRTTITFENEDHTKNMQRASEFIIQLLKETGRVNY